MVASLGGVIFHQVYGDNSGGAEFDTDGDGTATQEDEFVSFQNTTGASVDISGWQIWSDMTGGGAPDSPQDGLYHTFPSGTVLAPGEVLYVINEITGTPTAWMQEASEGGLESGAGGVNTNFLTEGGGGAFSEGLALVDPDSGDYIIINLASVASPIPGFSGFPGTTLVAETNAVAQSGQDDQNAGSSYQYDADADSYEYTTVFVPCFAPETLIQTPGGEVPAASLKAGDLVATADHGPARLAWVGVWTLRFDEPGGGDGGGAMLPVEIKPGALGPGLPRRCLVISPQHRMLLSGPAIARRCDEPEALCLAKGLLGRRGVRRMKGKREMTYIALLFHRHEIIFAEGAPTESFHPGAYILEQMGSRLREEVFAIHPRLRTRPGEGAGPPARRRLTLAEARDVVAAAPGPLVAPRSAEIVGPVGAFLSAADFELKTVFDAA